MSDTKLWPIFAAISSGHRALRKDVIFSAQQRAPSFSEMRCEAAECFEHGSADGHVGTHGGPPAKLLCLTVMEKRERSGHEPVRAVLLYLEPGGSGLLPVRIDTASHQRHRWVAKEAPDSRYPVVGYHYVVICHCEDMAMGVVSRRVERRRLARRDVMPEAQRYGEATGHARNDIGGVISARVVDDDDFVARLKSLQAQAVERQAK